MKQLIFAVTLAAFATPVLACPGHDEAAPKTAETTQPLQTADKTKAPAKKVEPTKATSDDKAQAKKQPAASDAKKPS